MKDTTIKTAVEAKATAISGATILWNTRLELLAETGDIRGVIDHLQNPIELQDTNNCGCNVQCGAQLLDAPGIER